MDGESQVRAALRGKPVARTLQAEARRSDGEIRGSLRRRKGDDSLTNRPKEFSKRQKKTRQSSFLPWRKNAIPANF